MTKLWPTLRAGIGERHVARGFLAALAAVVSLLSSPVSADGSAPAAVPGVPAAVNVRITTEGGVARLSMDLSGPIDFTYGPTERSDVLAVALRGLHWRFPTGRRAVGAGPVAEYVFIADPHGGGTLFLRTAGPAQVVDVELSGPQQTRAGYRLQLDVAPLPNGVPRARQFGFVPWATRLATRASGGGDGDSRFLLHRVYPGMRAGPGMWNGQGGATQVPPLTAGQRGEVRPVVRQVAAIDGALRVSEAMLATETHMERRPAKRRQIAQGDSDMGFGLDPADYALGSDTEIPDPLEDMNRAIFAANDFLDRMLIRPVAWVYGKVVPPPLKDGFSNAFYNMKEPVHIANGMLQTDFEEAASNTGRFLLNTLLGLGGLYDVASAVGLPRQPADFGQTLYSYGVGSGPYLIIPVLGPSNLRDLFGAGADMMMHPFAWILTMEERILLNAGEGTVMRESVLKELDDLRATSIDYYAAIRSFYWQNRQADVREMSDETELLSLSPALAN